MPFQQEPIQNFIGKGITFPLRLIQGKPPLETGITLIQASLRNIFAWPKGFRFFLHQYGHDLEGLLEEPNDDVAITLAEHYIRDAIELWERRIDIIDLEVFRPEDDDSSSLFANLRARVKNTKDEFTFTFPFYEKIIY